MTKYHELSDADTFDKCLDLAGQYRVLADFAEDIGVRASLLNRAVALEAKAGRLASA
jgi:hypothetical protein